MNGRRRKKLLRVWGKMSNSRTSTFSISTFQPQTALFRCQNKTKKTFNVTLTNFFNILFQLKLHFFYCESFSCFRFSRMIRSSVLSLPRISIISATPGPSLSPLSVVRRLFMRFENVKLFSDENSLRIWLRFCLLNFSSFSSSTSESMISEIEVF